MRMCCDTPQISVLMGVLYRKTDTALLERSVRSILNQTFTDFEMLICDSGSSVQTCNLLNKLAEEDRRIRLIREEGFPTDLAHKLNACLRHARGTFVARMDDDDFSYPERFARQMDYLNNHDNIAFVGCNVALQTDRTKSGSRSFPEYPAIRDFYMTQPFIHPTLIFRKTALTAVGGYSEEERQELCEDYDLLLRLYTAGFYGANLQEVLFDYTVPVTAHGNRRMCHRWNETVTRWCRFRELRLLPKAFPYVIKPLVVGILPDGILSKLKKYE